MNRQVKEFIKDVIKYIPAQVGPAIVGIFAIPIITRLFVPADYGNYVLVMASISILGTLVRWLNMSIIRFYPIYERDSKLQEFYSTTVKVLFASVVILAITLLVILHFVKYRISTQLYLLMFIGTLAFVLNSFFHLFQDFLRMRRLLHWYTFFSIWNSIAYLGIGLIFILVLKAGIEGLLLGSVLSIAVILPLLWKIAIEKSPLKTRKVSTVLAKEMARYGFPLVVGNLAAWVLSFSDRYILEFFKGSGEVGIYSASYAISEKTIFLINSLFSLAGGPIGMKIWETEDKDKTTEFISQQTRYYLIVCLPAVVGLSVLAKPVIELLTAQQYYESHRIVPLVAFSGFFLGLQHRFQWGLSLHKKTHFVMFCIIVSGLLNIGLNILLVPKYGYMGAAVTTLTCYALFLILMIFISRYFFVWGFPFRSLGRIMCAAAIMGGVVHYLDNNLNLTGLFKIIFCIGSGATLYFMLLLVLKEIKPGKVQELLGLKRREIT